MPLKYRNLEAFLAEPIEVQDKWLKGCQGKTLEEIRTKWEWWQRDDQAEPKGDWHTWLVLAGRGFGKTRMGAEWVRSRAEKDKRLRIALVGATLDEVRKVMVEGQSGLLAIAPTDNCPKYYPALKKLEWPNGAIATLYGATEPDSLRGPEHHIAWCDEIAKWDRADDAWDNLAMTLRLSNRPQVMATTTPRPMSLVRRLLADRGTQTSRGQSQANALHLPDSWMADMEALYGGTRLGRQELAGEILEDAEDAFWKRSHFEGCRVTAAPALTRVVIGVDPPASASGDACGIVVVGLGKDGLAYVLADASVSGLSPEGWASAVARAAAIWEADRVIAEANQGGDMVVSTLLAADVSLPVRKVHASRGKAARAEPVSALYERGKVKHAGAMPALEDQLCGFTPSGYFGPGQSPDRADALVWALTELMLGKRSGGPRVVVF